MPHNGRQHFTAPFFEVGFRSHCLIAVAHERALSQTCSILYYSAHHRVSIIRSATSRSSLGYGHFAAAQQSSRQPRDLSNSPSQCQSWITGRNFLGLFPVLFFTPFCFHQNGPLRFRLVFSADRLFSTNPPLRFLKKHFSVSPGQNVHLKSLRLYTNVRSAMLRLLSPGPRMNRRAGERARSTILSHPPTSGRA